MNRRETRERAVELIFEASFHNFENPQLIYDTAKTVREFEDNDYVRTLVFGISENYSLIDEKIGECAKGWKTARISRMILSIMRLAVYEMLFSDDVPFNVAINEAIELTKEYAFDESPAFVNGVLNKIAENEGLKN